MRHLTLLALVGLLFGLLAFGALNAEAHHVGNADYNEIGPCEEYFYNPDALTQDEIDENIELTECWSVHGGVAGLTGLYPAPSDNMGGPSGPSDTSGTGTE